MAQGAERRAADAHADGELSLLSLRELPSWMRHNDFIETHYRPQLLSIRACLHTAFWRIHNETVNVWTHFIGLSVFFVLLLSALWATLPLLQRSGSSAMPADYYPLRAGGLMALPSPSDDARSLLVAEHARVLLPLLVAACYMFFASTLCHSCWVRSPRALSILSRLDFCGIAMLCAGHTMSGVRVMFYCDTRLNNPFSLVRVYTFVSAISAIATARSVLSPTFGGRRGHIARSVAFSCLGAVALAPLLHVGILHGLRDPEFLSMASWIVACLIMYGLAVLIYASRVPECCRPGKHDLWCSSHQFMHILVVCAAYIHYAGVKSGLEYRFQVGCSFSPLSNT